MDYPDEVEYLSNVLCQLDKAAEHADGQITFWENEYSSLKKYLADYRAEIDPREMFQNHRLLEQTDRSSESTARLRARIEQLRDSPYFARIDFRQGRQPHADTIYIGRHSFSDERRTMLIHDWRAPISSLYYDCEPGPASFSSPAGEVAGELVRKRQFKISDGHMRFVLENALTINDDILQQTLADAPDEKMTSIISTIQREQNLIIRSHEPGTMLIQGAAGSGKTSVALHRIAFLLYRFRGDLKAEDFLVFSPNEAFADYVSNVLPELGEEPIRQFGFEMLASEQLDKGLSHENHVDHVERMIDSPGPKWAARVRFKSSARFLETLNDFLTHADHAFFDSSELIFGKFTIPKEYIAHRWHVHRATPVRKRFALMAEDIMERLRTENVRGYPLPTLSAIRQALRSRYSVTTTMQLYREFYTWAGKKQFFVLKRKTLEWADVYPYLYVKRYYAGINGYDSIKHIVIDEMQDFTPVQYALVSAIFACDKTILGDFRQTVTPWNQTTLATLSTLFDNARVTELRKSYRSTSEIMEFAKRIQPAAEFDPVVRHGCEPVVRRHDGVEADGVSDLLHNLAGLHPTIGVVCKTRAQAQSLAESLAGEHSINLLANSNDCLVPGITVTSAHMAKGLEFDHVIVPGCNADNYALEPERALLYVACTRAINRLTLMFTGTPTAFLRKFV